MRKEYLEKIKELEKRGIPTKILPNGRCIFSLKEANQKLTASELIELMGEVYWHDGKIGHKLLKELGLIGYWVILKE
jgi:hypothetical protein